MDYMSSGCRWLIQITIVGLLIHFVWSNSTPAVLVQGADTSVQTLLSSDGYLQSNLTLLNSNSSSFVSATPAFNDSLFDNTTDLETVNSTVPSRLPRLLSIDPVLNVSVHEKPWFNHTILFDEALIESWIACLGNDEATRCLTNTEYIFGTPYLHNANLTSQTTSDNNTRETFVCRLEDPRFIQDNGVVACSRGLTPCNDTLGTTACSVSILQNTAQFYWDVSQDMTLEFKSQFVNVSCGNECFQDPVTLPTSATTEAIAEEASDKDKTYIWIIVGVALGVFLIAAVVTAVILFYRRRRKNKKGSKTLVDGNSKPPEVRSSVLFHREEDPSDELRVPENDDISGVAYVNIELSDPSKRKSSAPSMSSSVRKENEYSNDLPSGSSNRVSNVNDKVNVKSDSATGGSRKGNGVKAGDIKHSSSIDGAHLDNSSGDVPDKVETSKNNSYAKLRKTQHHEPNTYDSLQRSNEEAPPTETITVYSQPNLSGHSTEQGQSKPQDDGVYANSEKGSVQHKHARNYSDQDETDGAYGNLSQTFESQVSGSGLRAVPMDDASTVQVYSLAQHVPEEASSPDNTYFELENQYANSSD